MALDMPDHAFLTYGNTVHSVNWPAGITIFCLMHRKILSWLLTGAAGRYLSHQGPLAWEKREGRLNGDRDRNGADLTPQEGASMRRLQNQECWAQWHSASLMVFPLPRARKVARARSRSLTVRSLNSEFWGRRDTLRSWR